MSSHSELCTGRCFRGVKASARDNRREAGSADTEETPTAKNLNSKKEASAFSDAPAIFGSIPPHNLSTKPPAPQKRVRLSAQLERLLLCACLRSRLT